MNDDTQALPAQAVTAAIERIAAQWDGRMYAGPGGYVDIGRDIRAAAQAAPAEARWCPCMTMLRAQAEAQQPADLTDAELADLIAERAERTMGTGGYDRYHALRAAAAALRGGGEAQQHVAPPQAPSGTDKPLPLPLTAEEIAHLRRSVHVLPPVWAGAVLRLCDAAEALAERDARIAELEVFAHRNEHLVNSMDIVMGREQMKAQAELERVRGLVDAHNALMAARCATSFCEDHTANPDLDRLGECEICAGCPRRDMIDADAAPGEVAR